ncbi:MAG: choice-of-anchor J domain-containing protein [Bacteroidota bacterium]|nr:choice-of-anchor J domain-containing protein [Bacteroidota bacterium]
MRNTAVLFTVFCVFIFGNARSQITSYSFTSGTATYTSITGTSPLVIGNGTDPVFDEGYANGIPIGFTFIYLGNFYTAISASTNGFAALGTIGTAGFSNSLANNGIGKPILAPLWEDLALTSVSNLKYSTTGSTGSRIFTLQWDNVFFDFGASAPGLSFQLRLYETTNVIEFIYNQLPGVAQDFSGGASIGITGNGSFLSLSNSSASPVISSVKSTDTIVTKPATGQVYRFTPLACSGPGVGVSSITANSAVISWGNAGAPFYEYAVTTSATPPVSGVVVSGNVLGVTNLAPCTQYYLYVRKDCGGGTWSTWNSMRFVTVCNAVNPPYTMPISGVISPDLPIGTVAKDENHDGNTWQSYPSGGQGWTDQVLAYVYNSNGTTAANDWLFTQGLNLAAGNAYRLKFKYNNDFTSLYTEKLKVAYGTSATAAAMTNILGNYPSVSSANPQTASIDFTPSDSGIYYIGFQAYSDANKDVLILDDISVGLRPSCDMPVALAASVQSTGTSADISWSAPSIGSVVGYEYAVTTSNIPPGSGTAINALTATVGGLNSNAQYYLHVRTNCGGTFSDWSTLAFTTLVNDDVCKAITITQGGAPVCGNTTLATTVPTDPYSSCSTPNNTVWYKYTAVADGTIVLHMTTPASPARPLHGWVNWYMLSGDCPNVSFTNLNRCSEFGNNGNNDADDLLSPSLTAGTTYYIMVDGFSGEYGEFCISIPACSPALSVRIDNITGSGADVNWAGTGAFILEYGAPGFTPGTGAVAGAGGTIITATSSPKTITGLPLSTTYDVYLRQNCTGSSNGYSNNSVKASFTTLGPPPANDDCSGAIPLTISNSGCSAPVAGTTLNASPSGTLPLPVCGTGSQGYDDDVWYSFIPSADQPVVNIDFALTGGNGDLVAQIYTSSDNTCSGTFTAYACSDDEGPGSLPLFRDLEVTPGTVYFIRVFTFAKSVNSQFTICAYKAILPNDNAPGALRLLVNEGCSGATYTNAGATHSPDEPTGSCSSLRAYSTVWFKFDAPVGGAVRVSTAAGDGNTLTNTRMALFQTTDVNDYSTFRIIGCNEDCGIPSFEQMSVLYATGLIPGTTYYIEVDKFDSTINDGMFCITVDSLTVDMLSPHTGCNMPNRQAVASIAGYTGWVSLMDENGKLMALVRNTSGASASDFSVVQNIYTGPVRRDTVSGEYYLNRSYKLTNAAAGDPAVNVQLFFTNTELAALRALDPAASVANLRATRQGAAGCNPDFVATNGTNTELQQASSGTENGVSWVGFNGVNLSNFYIHATKSFLTAKVFLQGAYNPTLSRHKDVTSTWANVLNTYALNQPYNTAAFGNYTGTESVAPGFYHVSSSDSDVLDWVLLEIKNSSGTTISQRAAFVREDGQIVDLDGISPVSLYGLSSGNANLSIHHRNHLGIRTSLLMSFTANALGVHSSLSSYDFTISQDQAYQNPAITTNPAMAQNGSAFMMWAGNANLDGYIRVTSQILPPIPSDASYILGTILNGNPNLTMTGYLSGDLNLDGNVRCTSQILPPIASDASFILGTSLSGNPNGTRQEHK